MRKLMWVTLGFGTACAFFTYFYPGAWALPPAAALLLGFGVLQVYRDRHGALAMGALLCLGAALGLCWSWFYDGTLLRPARAADGTVQSIQVELRDWPVETQYGCSVDGTVVLEGRSYRILLYLNNMEQALQPGDRLTLRAQLRLTTDGGQSEPTYHRSNGIFLLGYQRGGVQVRAVERIPWRYAPAVIRREVSARLRLLFPRDAAGFVQALLLGDRTGLPYAQRNQLSLAGISHVVAVSGMHVSILFALIYTLVGRRRALAALLGIPAVILFAAMAGFFPSVSRAALMQILMLAAGLLGREYDPPSALSAAALMLLVLNPVVAASVSFQLSVGAMAGIFLFSGRLYRFLTGRIAGPKGFGCRMLRFLASSVSVTLGASALTAPIVAWTFGVVSLLGVLTNVLALWAVSLVFYGAIFACLMSLLWLPLGRGIAWCTAWFVRYILLIAEGIAGIPLAAVYTSSPYVAAWMYFVPVLLCLFLLNKCRRKRFFAGALTLSLGVSMLLSYLEPMEDPYRVTVLNVGQGQCVLLQAAGRTFVVDCGGSNAQEAGEQAARYLLSQGVYRVDGLILTHFDEDHAGGAAQLMDRLQVKNLFLPYIEGDETGLAIGQAAEGSVYYVTEDLRVTFGEACLRIFAPLSQTTSNESGLSILFTAGECDTLITGDMNEAMERRLLATHSLPDVELLVAGHHGSKNATGQALLQAVRPEVVAISVGDNSYGHPAPEMLERAAQAGALIYRTDQQGTLIFRGG